MLKSAETNDKLQSSDGGSKSTLKAGLRETFDITENSARRHARNNAQKYYNEELNLASEALLGTNEDKVINLTDRERVRESIHDMVDLRTSGTLRSEGGDKLITASKRRARAEALREGRESSLLEGMDDANAKKLRDNRKKMQSKLRKSFEVKTEVKGGVVSDLRVERSVQDKLTDTPKHSPSDLADSIGKRALHFLDDTADGGDANSIQNAWIDTADKGAEGASTIYSISQTAKYWRRSKNEAEIAKLSKQRDKIIKNNYRMQYKSALKTAKESELWRNSNFYEKSLQKKAIKRKYMKNAIAEYKKAKKAGSTGKVTYTTGLNIFDKAKAGAKSIGQHLLRCGAYCFAHKCGGSNASYVIWW